MKILPDMIGITTSNMERSLSFYRQLGLNIPEGQENQSHVEVITENGYRIAWDTVELAKSLSNDWLEPQGQRITLAFKVESSQDVDTLTEKLKSAGYTISKEPWDAFWGQRYAVAKDPDGNNVDIFASL